MTEQPAETPPAPAARRRRGTCRAARRAAGDAPPSPGRATGRRGPPRSRRLRKRPPTKRPREEEGRRRNRASATFWGGLGTGPPLFVRACACRSRCSVHLRFRLNPVSLLPNLMLDCRDVSISGKPAENGVWTGCVGGAMVALGRRACHRLRPSPPQAQDSKSAAVPVEAAKVIAAPLSEQVTAIGTLLSDEAVTVSSEIPGRLKRDPLPGRPAGREGGAAIHPRQLGLSRPARRRRSQAQARRADQQANQHAVHQQIRDRPVGRRVGLEPRREHGRRRARPRAAREGAHRGAVRRHRRSAPCQRRRIHHRGPGAGQSRGDRSGKGRFPGAREISAGHQGRPDHPHQGRRVSRGQLRGQGLRHRSPPRRRRPQPAGPRHGAQ